MTFARSVPFLLAAALLQISCSDDDPVSTTLTGSWAIVAATGPAFSSSAPVRLPELHFSADGTFFLLSDVRDEDTACEMEVNSYACRSHETVEEDTLDPGYSCSHYGSCGTYTLAPVSAEATRAAPEEARDARARAPEVGRGGVSARRSIVSARAELGRTRVTRCAAPGETPSSL